MGKGKRAAIYVRVSTDEQSVENQEAELRATAERMGHEIVAVYRDMECALDGGQFQAAVLTGCWACRSSYCAGLR
jgi:predicted site-specific integrase-resolvase